MKQVVTILIIGIACTGTVQSTVAQDQFRNRIQAIQKELVSTTGMEVAMDIKVFEQKNDKIPFYHEQAVVKKSNDNYFYRFSGLEMLMNAKYLVLVNEKERLITCSLRDKKSEAELMDPLSANLDSLLKFYGTPKLVSEENDVEHYTLTHEEGLIRQTELYIQLSTSSLKRIEYLYEGGQYAVIEFMKFNRTPNFGPNEFTEQKYFRDQNGVLKLSENYSRFRLTTQ